MSFRHKALDVPNQTKRVFLHACCAPCSGAILECLLASNLEPMVYFFNPNIYPEAEYERRKAELVRLAEKLSVPFLDGDYNTGAWHKAVEGLEGEPERGGRCTICFRVRLNETARQAALHSYSVFTTTLASSRWKNMQQIAVAGHTAAAAYPGLMYWEQNWRKGGLSERRSELVREMAFYNQTYCGCVYSLRGNCPEATTGTPTPPRVP